jgi:hypothetical protein
MWNYFIAVFTFYGERWNSSTFHFSTVKFINSTEIRNRCDASYIALQLSHMGFITLVELWALDPLAKPVVRCSSTYCRIRIKKLASPLLPTLAYGVAKDQIFIK